jgi:cytochrome P450
MTAAGQVLDGLGFAALLARLSDRGAAPSLPPAVEAGSEPVPLAVIDTPEVFALGVLLRPQFGRATPVLRGTPVKFILSSSEPVVLDLGDGSPDAEVAPGQTVTAAYPADAGEVQLLVTRAGRSAGLRIGLDLEAPRQPDETWDLPGGTAWMLRAAGHDALRCPLVCVEGFPGGHGFAFSHDVLAQQGVLDRLLGRGFDLVVVGLEDGTRPLEDNAPVVEACLAEVARRTPLPVTLLGWSMGGLLCRLALSAIEGRGEAHQVTTLVTWDTPHRGCVTQLGVQWLVSQFAPKHPALQPHAAEIDSPANREMVVLTLQPDGEAAVDPRRTALVEALSWPRQPRRVLLSCGWGGGRDGRRGDVRAGQVLVHWQSDGNGEIHLRAVGGTHPVGEGTWDDVTPPPLEVTDGVAWDGVPGARGTYPAEAAGLLQALAGGTAQPIRPPAVCQVPTVSALDLDQPPDEPVPEQPDLITCATDQLHLVIDVQAAARLLEQIGSPFDPAKFDPHDPVFLADPFPSYDLFRRFAPRFSVGGGALWCFLGEDCETVLQDKEVWVKRPPQPPPPGPGPTAALAGLPPGLFSSDPEAHTALRHATEEAFRGALDRAAQVAGQWATQILAGLEGTEAVELVQDFALPLPANVLFDLLGLAGDPILRQTLITWQQAIASAHDSTQSPGLRLQGATCAMALRSFFAGLVYSHALTPVPGLVGALCDAFDAERIGREELLATLCDLLIAGYLSTTYLISNGMNRLLAEPSALARLRDAPDLIPAAVEELLRLEGPVQLIDRVADRATALGGTDLPAGTHVALVVASANHDPAWFSEPEDFRPDRDGARRHLAFGDGIHVCVGAPLARIVAPIAFRALLAYELELDGEPQWQTDPYLRGAISLPLRMKRPRA